MLAGTEIHIDLLVLVLVLGAIALFLWITGHWRH
jgi:hypothetical protein